MKRLKQIRPTVNSTWLLPAVITILLVVILLILWLPQHEQLRSIDKDIENLRTGIDNLPSNVPVDKRLEFQKELVEAHGKRLELQNNINNSLIQAIGGSGLLFLLTVYLTLRSIQFTEKKEFSERYRESIKQLGDELIEVRIAAMYSLQSMTEDSPKDSWIIMEILASMIRKRSSFEALNSNHNRVVEDVQVALRIIGLRDTANDPPNRRLELARCNLRETQQFGANFQSISFFATDFSSSHLREANFRNAYLRETNFRKAQMRKSIFEKANLRSANLQQVFLKEAKLRGAALEGALLSEANLIGAVLEGATLKGATLCKANLGETDLRLANFEEADLTEADLKQACLESAQLVGATLVDANLTEATLKYAVLNFANLSGADLTEADLEGAELVKANLTDAILIGTNLRGADLSEAVGLTKEQVQQAILNKQTLLTHPLLED